MKNNELKLDYKNQEFKTYRSSSISYSIIKTVCMKCGAVKISENEWKKEIKKENLNEKEVLSHGICPTCYDIELKEFYQQYGE